MRPRILEFLASTESQNLDSTVLARMASKKKGPKIVDSLETHFSDSEATWDNFNYKKIMASEVSIAAALAAALARLFMAAILLVSTAPIGSSPVS